MGVLYSGTFQRRSQRWKWPPDMGPLFFCRRQLFKFRGSLNRGSWSVISQKERVDRDKLSFSAAAPSAYWSVNWGNRSSCGSPYRLPLLNSSSWSGCWHISVWSTLGLTKVQLLKKVFLWPWHWYIDLKLTENIYGGEEGHGQEIKKEIDYLV